MLFHAVIDDRILPAGSRNPILEVGTEDMDDEEVGMQFTTTATEDLKVQADIMVSISVCKYGPGDQQRRD
ncbi:hypothetical protein D9613_012637 [Agrocybe pediades]|uniref:Uncharacterized protein n=1 Tax=Agrocybe pediades TaxID=84607 RepID=A0A8H4QVQ7_9AGAR|nr:hypothetical protein D9613_012637 [Agrocybe pediades]